MQHETTWKVRMPVIGNVDLNFDFDDVQFRREKDQNLAIVVISAPQREVLDLALAEATRGLNKLAIIYDEGLWATKEHALVECAGGPIIRERNEDGRITVLNGFTDFTVYLLKDERQKDTVMSKLLNKPTDEVVLSKLLGLYNKGLRSTNSNPFDAFLSFWGCVETIVKKQIYQEPKGNDFINFLAKFNVPKKEAKELYGRYRNAIAHSEYDPSSLKEMSKVSSKIPRIKDIAKRAIKNFISG
jgi:hypothetical protein